MEEKQRLDGTEDEYPEPLDLELWKKCGGNPTEYLKQVLNNEIQEKLKNLDKNLDKGDFAYRNGLYSELRDIRDRIDLVLNNIFFNPDFYRGKFRQRFRLREKPKQEQPTAIIFPDALIELEELEDLLTRLVKHPDPHKYFDVKFAVEQRIEAIEKALKQMMEED